MRKILNEVRELIKDKGFIVWNDNIFVEEILEKYGLYEDRKTFVNTTTRLCMELSEEFYNYEVEDKLIFSTQELTYYVHLGEVMDTLGDKLFTREELRQAVNEVGTTFNDKPLSESSLEKIYELIYNEDNGLIRDTVFIGYNN